MTTIFARESCISHNTKDLDLTYSLDVTRSPSSGHKCASYKSQVSYNSVTHQKVPSLQQCAYKEMDELWDWIFVSLVFTHYKITPLQCLPEEATVASSSCFCLYTMCPLLSFCLVPHFSIGGVNWSFPFITFFILLDLAITAPFLFLPKLFRLNYMFFFCLWLKCAN